VTGVSTAAQFQTDVRLSRNKYIWLGSDKVFGSFTMPSSAPIAVGSGLTPTVAHTTYSTIGWGTKLAMEDVIELAENLRRHDSLKAAVKSYERQRQAALMQPQSDARFSAQWFE
jgi:hypothetical protein